MVQYFKSSSFERVKKLLCDILYYHDRLLIHSVNNDHLAMPDRMVSQNLTKSRQTQIHLKNHEQQHIETNIPMKDKFIQTHRPLPSTSTTTQ